MQFGLEHFNDFLSFLSELFLFLMQFSNSLEHQILQQVANYII